MARVDPWQWRGHQLSAAVGQWWGARGQTALVLKKDDLLTPVGEWPIHVGFEVDGGCGVRQPAVHLSALYLTLDVAVQGDHARPLGAAERGVEGRKESG